MLRHCTITIRFVILLVAFVFSSKMNATTWSADNIQMVHLQDRSRYVCDPDDLMGAAARDSADFYLRRLQTECGIQTVFIVVDNVKNADCFRMAEDVGNKYGVGDKRARRGLVVVIAVNDRKYFIAPGKGLEGDLTDVECDDIARACIVSKMKVNDIDNAVLSTSKTLYGKFKTGKVVVDGENMDDEGGDSLLTLVLVLAICFGVPFAYMIKMLLVRLGICKPGRKTHNRHDNDNWIPPFFLGGGGGWSSGGSGWKSGGSFGGGSFGGGGAGGDW